MKQSFFFLLAILFSLCAVAQPIDNPYTSKYGNDPTHWTNAIKWNTVYNINAYAGANWDEKLTNAQADAVSKGGGIIYFPAGTYLFNNDITLQSKVVLRGETPIYSNALETNFAPPTRFVFPQYVPSFTGSGTDRTTSFRRIRSQFTDYGARTTIPADTVQNTGLVYIDINRANIILHPSYVDYLPKGSGSTNYIPCGMRNVILFGVRNNNVMFPEPTFPDPAQPSWNQWQRWPWRYIANVDALAQENLVICNNRFNDNMNNTLYPIADESFDQPGYVIYNDASKLFETIADGAKARYEYNNHYGLVVNRFYNFYTIANGKFASGDLIIANDYAAEAGKGKYPSLFNKGVQIENNYLYNTQQVAFFVAGQGMVIKNNVLRNKSNKAQWVSRSGWYKIKYNAYLENRGIDFSGADIVIENNDVEVYNTRFEASNYFSNDGEGIMVQECCGGSKPLNLKINNNTLKGTNAYIGLYKTQDISHVSIEGNQLSGQQIYVNANTNSLNYSCNDVRIQNNSGAKNITLRGDKFGANCSVKNNIGSGTIDVNCYVELLNNTGFTLKTCSPIVDYAAEPDSICWGTFCSPNTNKLQAQCFKENGFPVVRFANSDTIVLTNQNTVRLNIQKVSGVVDSIVVYNNNNIVYRNSLLPNYIDVPINDNDKHFFRMQAFGCSTLYPFYVNSNSVMVYKPQIYQLTSQIEVPQIDYGVPVYPNPAVNQLFLTTEIGSAISIYSLTGKLIESLTSNGWQQNIDVTSLQPSIYIIKVLSPKGLLNSYKFVKE